MLCALVIYLYLLLRRTRGGYQRQVYSFAIALMQETSLIVGTKFSLTASLGGKSAPSLPLLLPLFPAIYASNEDRHRLIGAACLHLIVRRLTLTTATTLKHIRRRSRLTLQDLLLTNQL